MDTKNMKFDTEKSKRKTSSVDSQFCDMDSGDDESQLYPHMSERRFSVPEKTLLSSDYAIMRQSSGLFRFQIVTALDRYTDPYKQYMQSIICYDLAPSHGIIVLIDSQLKLHKALNAMKTSSQSVSMIVDAHNQLVSIVSHSDCLQVIMLAEKDENIGEKSVHDYLRIQNGKKRLITANANLSVWDAARLFCANRVHRIPIMNIDETDVLYFLSLRTIFADTVLKQTLETRYQLAPHVTQATLADALVGTWNNVDTIFADAQLRSAINVLLQRKISSIPVVDNTTGCITGVLTKQDVVRLLTKLQSTNYLDVLSMTVHDAMTDAVPAVICRPTNTISEAIEMIMADDVEQRQCAFVVDDEGRPIAAVALIDLMDYILTSAEHSSKPTVAYACG